eukprot:04510.XXX_97610_97911_1 [CDS] Oithona nana genome sequencing.
MKFILILTLTLMISSQANFASSFSIMNRFPTRLTFYTGMNNFQNRLSEFSPYYSYRGVKRNVGPNDEHISMDKNVPISCF